MCDRCVDGYGRLGAAMGRAAMGRMGEPQPVLVEPGTLRELAGRVESIAHSRRVGLPGLAVDLEAGLAGLERALEEIEDRCYSDPRFS